MARKRVPPTATTPATGQPTSRVRAATTFSILGEADDARGLDRVSCKSPFFASSGAACGVTRGQLADACVAALADRDARLAALQNEVATLRAALVEAQARDLQRTRAQLARTRGALEARQHVRRKAPI